MFPMITNIHVDCDSLWIYASEYGTSLDADDDVIFRDALPRLVELFGKYGVRATFFIVGRDLALPKCREFCRLALSRGHALANHTFSHLQDLHHLDDIALEDEIKRCHDSVLASTGASPIGLRLPGYYFDRRIVPILNKLDYRYDSSILPGWGVYLMAIFYKLFNSAGEQKRFGRAWYPFARCRPYRILGGDSPIWELPLATCPLLRLPVHSTFVFQMGLSYFRFAYALRRLLHLDSVLLFHAIDLLDESLASNLKDKLPVLQSTLESRHAILGNVLQMTAPSVASSEQMFADNSALLKAT
jgi:hypothetical protein